MNAALKRNIKALALSYCLVKPYNKAAAEGIKERIMMFYPVVRAIRRPNRHAHPFGPVQGR